jgi:hypothetical protein
MTTLDSVPVDLSTAAVSIGLVPKFGLGINLHHLPGFGMLVAVSPVANGDEFEHCDILPQVFKKNRTCRFVLGFLIKLISKARQNPKGLCKIQDPCADLG